MLVTVPLNFLYATVKMLLLCTGTVISIYLHPHFSFPCPKISTLLLVYFKTVCVTFLKYNPSFRNVLLKCIHFGICFFSISVRTRAEKCNKYDKKLPEDVTPLRVMYKIYLYNVSMETSSSTEIRLWPCLSGSAPVSSEYPITKILIGSKFSGR